MEQIFIGGTITDYSDDPSARHPFAVPDAVRLRDQSAVTASGQHGPTMSRTQAILPPTGLSVTLACNTVSNAASYRVYQCPETTNVRRSRIWLRLPPLQPLP